MRASGVLFFMLVTWLPLPTQADTWAWEVTPYAWLPSITLDSDVERSSRPEIQFKSLVDTLDFAAQVHLEGKGKRFGTLLDFTNVQTSDRRTRSPFEVDTDFAATMVEAAVTVPVGDAGVELMLGLRALDTNLDIEFETTGAIGALQEASADATLLDGLAGIRYQTDLADQWSLSLRADVAAGDTDATWNASAILGYQLSKASVLRIGYRYMDARLGDIDDTETELRLAGFAAGLTFLF